MIDNAGNNCFQNVIEFRSYHQRTKFFPRFFERMIQIAGYWKWAQQRALLTESERYPLFENVIRTPKSAELAWATQ